MNAKSMLDVSTSPLSPLPGKTALSKDTHQQQSVNRNNDDSYLEKRNNFKASLDKVEKANRIDNSTNHQDDGAMQTPVDVNDATAENSVVTTPLVANEQTSAVNEPLSAINKTPLASNEEPLVINEQLLAVDRATMDGVILSPAIEISADTMATASPNVSATGLISPSPLTMVSSQGNINPVAMNLRQTTAVNMALPANLTTLVTSSLAKMSPELKSSALSLSNVDLPNQLALLGEDISSQTLLNTPVNSVSNGLSSAALPTNPPAIPQLPINTPFGNERWSGAVTERVMWMSAQGIKEASIRLDPPELGSLAIKISMSGEQAHVSFTVQHANVREALDQNSIRLREMFAQEGLDLTDVDVSDQSSSDQYAEKEERKSASYTTDTLVTESESLETESSAHITVSTRLVDSYV